ncbi:UNVERIFIED_CONTAM: hypothetical protein N8J90_04805 [Halobacillus marinus]
MYIYDPNSQSFRSNRLSGLGGCSRTNGTNAAGQPYGGYGLRQPGNLAGGTTGTGKFYPERKSSCSKQYPECDIAETVSVNCNSEGFGGGFFLPVVLRDVELQALVESEITLPTAAREIKNVRRNVYLTQCKAIPSIATEASVNVFVSGYIHKNIQYVEECSGYLQDYSVEVPFSCNQTVEIENFPTQFFSEKSTSTGERIFVDKKGMGGDHCVSGGLTFEYYNEPIECRLLFSAVNDIDLYKHVDKWGRFCKIVEKAEVLLIFRLIQSQQFDELPDGEEPGAQNQATQGRIQNKMNRGR